MTEYVDKIIGNLNKKSNPVCYVKEVGYVQSRPNFTMVRQDSPDIIIAFITKGKGILYTSTADFPLYSGDCVVFNANKYTKLVSDNSNPAQVTYLKCSGELVQSIIKCYFPDVHPIISTCDLSLYFKQIKEFISSPSRLSDDFVTLSIHKMLITMKNYFNVSLERRNRAVYIDNIYEKYIIENVNQKFSVENFAKHFDLTVNELTKVCKNKFNKTPYQYYMYVKIELAKRMLANTALTIDDISLRLSFTDRAHFCKLFTREIGITPAEYRKQLKNL